MSIIAISRGTFSGGEAVARAIADRLGYRCVSREVVLEAAWAYGIPAEELIDAMEKRPPLWQRLTGERSDHITFVRAALCEHAAAASWSITGTSGTSSCRASATSSAFGSSPIWSFASRRRCGSATSCGKRR